METVNLQTPGNYNFGYMIYFTMGALYISSNKQLIIPFSPAFLICMINSIQGWVCKIEKPSLPLLNYSWNSPKSKKLSHTCFFSDFGTITLIMLIISFAVFTCKSRSLVDCSTSVNTLSVR